MGNVRRIYVAKKPEYAVKSSELKEEITVTSVSTELNRYGSTAAMMLKMSLIRYLKELAEKFFRSRLLMNCSWKI